MKSSRRNWKQKLEYLAYSQTLETSQPQKQALLRLRYLNTTTIPVGAFTKSHTHLVEINKLTIISDRFR